MALSDSVYNTLDLLDKETRQHCARVGSLARQIELYLKLPDNYLSNAGYVHDIGKLYISHNILAKPGKLTKLESNIIHLHSYFGYEILKNLDVDDVICQIVLYHHGLNVPTLEPVQKYADDKILERSKMLHTIDEFEALTANRAFRSRFTKAQAIAIMKEEPNHSKDVMQFFSSCSV